MLTPDQLKEHSFTLIESGKYSAEEVNRFFGEVIASYNQMYRENGELIRKISILANKVQQYRRDEDNIRNALLNAQRSAEEVLSDARRQAANIIMEANAEMKNIVDGKDGIVTKAREQAERLISEAEVKAENTVSAAMQEAEEIKFTAKTAAAQEESNARDSAETIVTDANNEAMEILTYARQEAEKIKSDAQEQSEQSRRQTEDALADARAQLLDIQSQCQVQQELLTEIKEQAAQAEEQRIQALAAVELALAQANKIAEESKKPIPEEMNMPAADDVLQVEEAQTAEPEPVEDGESVDDAQCAPVLSPEIPVEACDSETDGVTDSKTEDVADIAAEDDGSQYSAVAVEADEDAVLADDNPAETEFSAAEDEESASSADDDDFDSFDDFSGDENMDESPYAPEENEFPDEPVEADDAAEESDSDVVEETEPDVSVTLNPQLADSQIDMDDADDSTGFVVHVNTDDFGEYDEDEVFDDFGSGQWHQESESDSEPAEPEAAPISAGEPEWASASQSDAEPSVFSYEAPGDSGEMADLDDGFVIDFSLFEDVPEMPVRGETAVPAKQEAPAEKSSHRRHKKKK